MDKPTYDLWQEALRLMEQKEYEKAAEQFRKTIEAVPEMASPHYDLMNCLIKAGDPEGALQEAKQALRLAPASPLYLYNLGNAYQLAGRLDDAITTYSEFIHSFPANEKCARLKPLLKELKRAAAQRQDSPQQVGLSKGAFYKWRSSKMPLRVFIEPGDSAANYNETFKAILTESFQDWADASKGRVSFEFVTRRNLCNIDCVWESERTKLTEAEDGNTHIENDPNGMILSARIILLTTSQSGEAMSRVQIKEVALHEIGHALGINQHSRNPKDIMFYSRHGEETMRALTEHDKETLCQLYDCPDSMAPPVLPVPIQFQH